MLSALVPELVLGELIVPLDDEPGAVVVADEPVVLESVVEPVLPIVDGAVLGLVVDGLPGLVVVVDGLGDVLVVPGAAVSCEVEDGDGEVDEVDGDVDCE